MMNLSLQSNGCLHVEGEGEKNDGERENESEFLEGKTVEF